ncbi:MAG: LLM class flavin-dependent oxidoreductase [Thermoleophilia bacterium]
MHAGLRFGIFMPPIHQSRTNPTRALQRDLELVTHLDRLGFDEAWIGEHHSAGAEIISSPEIFIATVAERTRTIKLGTGVVSLPYHHPLMVADRLCMLDHLTRGRVMLGVGPGSLPSDAAMLGIEPARQRPMMAESLDAIVQLLRSDEPVTVETDWFTLREARMHLKPFTDPHFELAVAATSSPVGATLAGKHGIGLMSLGATTDIGFDALAHHWGICSEQAELAGQTVDRRNWRLVGLMHIAETREQAIADCRYGLDHYIEYFQGTAAFPQMAFEGTTFEERVDALNRSGYAVIGTPDDACRQIERLLDQSGGFGCYLTLAHEWANPEATIRSFDLISRYVMPEFQGSTVSTRASEARAKALRSGLVEKAAAAVQQEVDRYEQARQAR